jgi:quercetin dioxygenase-like cupin family protein
VGGQLLIVVAGEGHVADENGVVAVRAGDMVWTPPGVRHWHGASAGRYLIHTAITVGATNWEQAVSDEEYGRG